MSSGRPFQKDMSELCRPLVTFSILPYLKRARSAFRRMLLWNLRLYSHRSGWFVIIAAYFCDLNLKRLLSSESRDDDLDAWDSHGAQEGETAQ
jgi:hypothetical protein